MSHSLNFLPPLCCISHHTYIYKEESLFPLCNKGSISKVLFPQCIKRQYQECLRVILSVCCPVKYNINSNFASTQALLFLQQRLTGKCGCFVFSEVISVVAKPTDWLCSLSDKSRNHICIIGSKSQEVEQIYRTSFENIYFFIYSTSYPPFFPIPGRPRRYILKTMNEYINHQ